MHNPPRILIVDDNETNRDILVTRLERHGYELIQATNGEEALESIRANLPDLVLLDIMMPKVDGVEVCRQVKGDANFPFTPIILVTAKADSKDVVAGLEAGADEYLTKPIDQMALVARVKSVLRIKDLHDRVTAQAADLAVWNKTLEQRVADQLAEIERMGRLKRFLSPQIAEAVLASGGESILKSHRRDITVVFCDVRGFTSFSETAEPEDVMTFLREYHACLGTIVHKYDGTVERFTGDGLMVLFNDPLQCPDPSLRAVKMCVEMREQIKGLIAAWRKRGHDIGFGMGVAYGYATLGQIGFEGRLDYSATGTVVNLAARLCAEAIDGQILVDGKVCSAIEGIAEVQPTGELKLKGLHRPVQAFNVCALTATERAAE
ncbi:MAG TPA: response regulator [Pseudolabrys sp.]|nr:response regulator [Pseudolabrys sp.]